MRNVVFGDPNQKQAKVLNSHHESLRQIENALSSDNDEDLIKGIANLIKDRKLQRRQLTCIDEEAGHDGSLVRGSIEENDDLNSQIDDVATDRNLLPPLQNDWQQ